MTDEITVSAGSGTIRVGDVITFAGRPKWWKRLLRRLGWMKPEPPPRQFVVTWEKTAGRRPTRRRR